MTENRSTKYLIGLMFLLCVATFSEGYDFAIMSFVLDLLGNEFNYNINKVFQIVVVVVNCGAIVGFFTARLGDRFGRKPILIVGVFGFALCSMLTAMSKNIYWYIICQFFSKMFLVTEFGLAILIVTEEFPSSKRATYVGILEVAGALGGGLAMFLSGMIIPKWGWRTMYWLGVIPLVLVPVMLVYIKETVHFTNIKKIGGEFSRPLLYIWNTSSKKNTMVVGSLWFLSYICYASVIYIWPTYAKLERGWSEAELGSKIVVAFAVGMLGYIISGLLMDFLGRRVTSVVFFIGSAVTLILAFTVHQPYIVPAIAAAMFFIFALLPICSTFNSELFPTDVRANATAWSNYLLGRPAQVFAPFVIGSIGGLMGGIGHAARLMAIGPAIAIFIVIFFIPETKGINLDKVH